MRSRRNCWLLFAVALGCASPHGYQQWSRQLGTMADNSSRNQFFSKQDVSLLLAAPPVTCEPVPVPRPAVGLTFAKESPAVLGVTLFKKPPTVLGVWPASAAAEAQIPVGARISAVNGVPTPSMLDLRPMLEEGAASGPILLSTDRGSFTVQARPVEGEQCYWDLSSGGVASSGGSAAWGTYGGAAGSRGSAYNRFYRASCRFVDGWLVQCESNWQM